MCDFDKVRPVLERMAEIGLILCVHGEVADPQVDIFDREAVFIDQVLDPLRRATPRLRVVMEHITTAEGVAYVATGGGDLAGTITAHHLIINRNHILAGGIRPHYYCFAGGKTRDAPPGAAGGCDLWRAGLLFLAATAPPILTR